MRPKTLDDLTGPFKVGRQVVYRNCPCCARDTWKLYVDAQSGLWHCFGCNAAGKLDMGNANILAELHASASPPVVWNPIELPAFRPLSDRALEFLALKYGITSDMARRYSLVEGAGEYAGRVVIPYVGYLGDVIYFNSRSFTGAIPKYKSSDGRHPLYVPRWLNKGWAEVWDHRLHLVEGTFDAMKLDLAGIRVAAIGGTALPRYLLPALRRLASVDVRIMLDSDALDKALRLQRRLQPFVRGKVEVVVPPVGQDPGSMTIQQIREVTA